MLRTEARPEAPSRIEVIVPARRLRRPGITVAALGLVLVQYALGVYTLVNVVPIVPAVIHQAWAALVLLGIIVVSGGLVRLTGSGLGCNDWPNCNNSQFVDLSSRHAAIEQINRFFTFLVCIGVALAALAAWWRRPRRRDRPRPGRRRFPSLQRPGAAFSPVPATASPGTTGRSRR